MLHRQSVYLITYYAMKSLLANLFSNSRPKTSYLGVHFGTLTQRLVHPSAPVVLTKDLPRNEISYDFQSQFRLHISNSRTKPTGLDF